MRVRWSSGALADLERIEAFNLTRSEAWAARVETRLLSRSQALALTPNMGRPVVGNLRELSVPDVQYVLVYRMQPDEVEIVSAHSTREDRAGR